MLLLHPDKCVPYVGTLAEENFALLQPVETPAPEPNPLKLPLLNPCGGPLQTCHSVNEQEISILIHPTNDNIQHAILKNQLPFTDPAAGLQLLDWNNGVTRHEPVTSPHNLLTLSAQDAQLPRSVIHFPQQLKPSQTEHAYVSLLESQLDQARAFAAVLKRNMSELQQIIYNKPKPTYTDVAVQTSFEVETIYKSPNANARAFRRNRGNSIGETLEEVTAPKDIIMVKPAREEILLSLEEPLQTKEEHPGATDRFERIRRLERMLNDLVQGTRDNTEQNNEDSASLISKTVGQQLNSLIIQESPCSSNENVDPSLSTLQSEYISLTHQTNNSDDKTQLLDRYQQLMGQTRNCIQNLQREIDKRRANQMDTTFIENSLINTFRIK